MSTVDIEELRHIAEIEFNDITESHLSAIPEEALREFLTFAREILER